jgi:hypothetical protein
MRPSEELSAQVREMSGHPQAGDGSADVKRKAFNDLCSRLFGK